MASTDHGSNRRSKMRNIDTLPKSAVANMVVAAGSLERWLWRNMEGLGHASVETLDPQTLNNCLVEFFRTIKRPDGTDYKRRSLESLRCNLDRYLREVGYGHSIISSHLFAGSQNGHVMGAPLGSRRYTPKPPRKNRRCFMKDVGSIPKATVTNMVVSAGVFERWLSATYDDHRNIFEIPPDVLNHYLNDFFFNVKTPYGLDYKPRSLESLRWSLDRYLKATGYTESIISSPIFTKSQAALKLRIKMLQAKLNE